MKLVVLHFAVFYQEKTKTKPKKTLKYRSGKHQAFLLLAVWLILDHHVQ